MSTRETPGWSARQRGSFAVAGLLVGTLAVGAGTLAMSRYLGMGLAWLALPATLGLAAVAVAAFLGARAGAKAGARPVEQVENAPTKPVHRRTMMIAAAVACLIGVALFVVQGVTREASGAWLSVGTILIAAGVFLAGWLYPLRTVGRCVLWAVSLQIVGLAINFIANTGVRTLCADELADVLGAKVREAAKGGAHEGAKQGVVDGIGTTVIPIVRENEQLKGTLAQREAEIESLKAAALAIAETLADSGDSRFVAAAEDARERGDFKALQGLLVERAGRAEGLVREQVEAQVDRIRQIVAIASSRSDWATVEAWAGKGLALAPDDMFLVGIAGDLAVSRGQRERATSLFMRYRDHWKRISDADPKDRAARREHSVGLNRVGDALTAAGDGPGALAAYRAGMAIAQSLAASDPGNTEWRRDLSVSHENVGDALTAAGDGPGALAAYRAGMAIRESLAASDPGNAQWRRDLSVSHIKVGDALTAAGDGPGALAAYRAGMAIAQSLAASDPGNAQWQHDLSISHIKIGACLASNGDIESAVDELRKGRKIIQRLVKLDPGNALWKRHLEVLDSVLGGS